MTRSTGNGYDPGQFIHSTFGRLDECASSDERDTHRQLRMFSGPSGPSFRVPSSSSFKAAPPPHLRFAFPGFVRSCAVRFLTRFQCALRFSHSAPGRPLPPVRRGMAECARPGTPFLRADFPAVPGEAVSPPGGGMERVHGASPAQGVLSFRYGGSVSLPRTVHRFPRG